MSKKRVGARRKGGGDVGKLDFTLQMYNRLNGGNLLKSLGSLQEIKLHEEYELVDYNLVLLAVLGDLLLHQRARYALGSAACGEQIIED